jgi:LemA protein
LALLKKKILKNTKKYFKMIVFLIVGVALLVAIIVMYNNLVNKRNQIDNVFAALDAMLKKRFDLIPNLVATVKNYAQYEQSTLNNLVELRSKAINGNLTKEETVQLDNNFSQAMSRLVVLSESYPALRATENYQQLQRALNETEEQISAARRTYNAVVTDYNNSVQQFPSNLAANLFNFEVRSVLVTPEVQRENVNVNQLFQ